MLLVGPGLRSHSAHCWVLSGLCCCLPGRAACGGPFCRTVCGPCFAQENPVHSRLVGGTRAWAGLWKTPVQGAQFATREHFGCSFASDHLSSTHMTLTPGQSLSLSEHCHGVSHRRCVERKEESPHCVLLLWSLPHLFSANKPGHRAVRCVPLGGQELSLCCPNSHCHALQVFMFSCSAGRCQSCALTFLPLASKNRIFCSFPDT